MNYLVDNELADWRSRDRNIEGLAEFFNNYKIPFLGFGTTNKSKQLYLKQMAEINEYVHICLEDLMYEKKEEKYKKEKESEDLSRKLIKEILNDLVKKNLVTKKKIQEVISAAKNNNCSMRIGVNAGSFEKDILEKYKEPCPEALVESALRNIKIIEDEDFFNFKVSVKSSDVFLSIGAYRQLSKATEYPLHLGITEAGSFVPGSIKSSIGLGSLLLDGIGDTIRVSLSDDPVKEIKIGNEILKSLNLRNRGVKIISCPSCARQAFKVIDTVKILEDKLSHIKTPISLSIIGCVVNGPGEAALTDIGITGGGKGSNMLYLNGVQTKKLSSNDIISKVVELVEKKAEEIENRN